MLRMLWALRVPAPEEPGLLARGASPWDANDRAAKPQRGDSEPAAVCRPAGALLLEDAAVQGLTPLATDRRPFGTNGPFRFETELGLRPHG